MNWLKKLLGLERPINVTIEFENDDAEQWLLVVELLEKMTKEHNCRCTLLVKS